MKTDELRALIAYREHAIATGQARAEFGIRQQLQVAAVAAIPALLDVAEAAQRYMGAVRVRYQLQGVFDNALANFSDPSPEARAYENALAAESESEKILDAALKRLEQS